MTIAALVAALGALLAMAAPGVAAAASTGPLGTAPGGAAPFGFEVNYGAETPQGPTGAHTCIGVVNGGAACFQPHGDKIYVRDSAGDHHSVIGVWGIDSAVRGGWCINKHGNGTWAVCNKNFPEDQKMTLLAMVYDLPTETEIKRSPEITVTT